MLLDNGKATAIGPITEWRRSAHPHAFGLRRGDLVADALGGDLALELGERQQHVQGPFRRPIQSTQATLAG